jgi:hypothetical protein
MHEVLEKWSKVSESEAYAHNAFKEHLLVLGANTCSVHDLNKKTASCNILEKGLCCPHTFTPSLLRMEQTKEE